MMHQKIILRVVSKFLIPMIMLFGLYVQWHGDFGPGGGFQAGVIFGAAFILHAILFGVGTVSKVVTPVFLRLSLVAGVLLYAGTGVACMMLGANYLGYNVLGSTPLGGQHVGIVLVEFGVGITVAASMILIFNIFAGQNALDDEDEADNGTSVEQTTKVGR